MIEEVDEPAPSGVQATSSLEVREPREALEELSSSVYRVLRRLGVQPNELEDGIQSVLMQIWGRWAVLGKLPADELRAYACTVASGVAIDFARRRGRVQAHTGTLETEPVLDEPGPDDAVDQKRALEMLDTILRGMPEDRRVVFVLYEIEELGLHEIAHRLDVPVGTVASRLRKAREEYERAVVRLRAAQAFPGARR